MGALVLSIAIGALLGAGLGYFGQCTSGTCPLTSTWWRGALYGAAMGALFGIGSARRDAAPELSAVHSTNVTEIAEASFDEQVLRSEQPVMVDFYASWCGPCKKLAPRVAQLADEFAGKVKVAKIDVDAAPELARRYQIQALPTVMFFNQGRPVDSLVGLASIGELRDRTQALLSAGQDMLREPESQ